MSDDLFDLLPRHSLRDRAFAIAARVHYGQRDKAGLPYLLAHVVDVVNRLDEWDEYAVVVAWLHDVLEDTKGDPAELLALLRREFPSVVVDAVVAITYWPWQETRDEYYARVKANPIALTVKRADIASNTDPRRVRMLDPATRERLAAKYRHALEVLDS